MSKVTKRGFTPICWVSMFVFGGVVYLRGVHFGNHLMVHSWTEAPEAPEAPETPDTPEPAAMALPKRPPQPESLLKMRSLSNGYDGYVSNNEVLSGFV